jgi:two-component system, response regulator
MTQDPHEEMARLRGHWESAEILLVEDNPADAELTIRALRERNLANRIQVVRDGAEALSRLLGDGPEPPPAPPPRLILLDLKLPKVSGLEVLERIRSEERTRYTPVVVLTSSEEDPDVQAAYELGANGYVVKPVDFGQFAEAVKELSFYWLLVNRGAHGERS